MHTEACLSTCYIGLKFFLLIDIGIRSFRHADALQGSVMNKLLDSVTSGLLAEFESAMRDIDVGDPESISAHKTPLEMYAFLLQWFVSAAEKVKSSTGEEDAPAAPAPKSRRGRGGKNATTSRPVTKRDTQWTWSNQIPNTLALISKILRLKTHRIWTTTPDRDAFIK